MARRRTVSLKRAHLLDVSPQHRQFFLDHQARTRPAAGPPVPAHDVLVFCCARCGEPSKFPLRLLWLVRVLHASYCRRASRWHLKSESKQRGCAATRSAVDSTTRALSSTWRPYADSGRPRCVPRHCHFLLWQFMCPNPGAAATPQEAVQLRKDPALYRSVMRYRTWVSLCITFARLSYWLKQLKVRCCRKTVRT